MEDESTHESSSAIPLLRSTSFDSNMSDEAARDPMNVEHERSASRSDDSALEIESLSLFEKKSILINRELDSHGMGKYQWCIWSLCGFGYLIDLLWAEAFGLVLSPIQQEFGFGKAQSGNISVAFSSGLTAGAFVWGFLADIIGRRWAFNFTVLFASVFGLCLAVPNSYSAFLVLTAFVGFGVGGNVPIDTTICLEFIPQNRRFLLALLSVFQPLGVVITAALAYGFIPTYSCVPDFTEKNALKSCHLVKPGVECCSKDKNMGWRYLLYTLGGVTLFIFFIRFAVFQFQESPKYLVYRGHDEKAIKVLQNVAKFNGVECGITLEHLQALTTEHDSIASDAGRKPSLGGGRLQLRSTYREKIMLELDRYKILFSTFQMARLTILTWLTYICDFWGFTVAGFYLPTILATKNAALNLTLRQTYKSYIYIYFPGVVGVLLGGLLYNVPFMGRKWTMALSAGLMGASLFIFSAINSQASNIGLTIMEYFFQSMFNAVLYGWTPEAFPAPIRGTACGLASFFGRLFGIVAPLIAQHLYAGNGPDGKGDVNSVLYLAGGVTLLCVVWISLLPNKAVGAQSF